MTEPDYLVKLERSIVGVAVVGHGLTEASGKWTIKTIIEVAINQLSK